MSGSQVGLLEVQLDVRVWLRFNLKAACQYVPGSPKVNPVHGCRRVPTSNLDVHVLHETAVNLRKLTKSVHCNFRTLLEAAHKRHS